MNIFFNLKYKPHNPLINSGALAICSILQPNLNPSERFKYVENKFSQMAGGLPMGFNNAVFLSERETADRNFAIAYYMRENKCFPPTFELRELMDFYFQICSIEVTCESAGIMAGTLANGGINPLTNETVVSAAAARDTLSVMHSCGMYDYSGQFAFKTPVSTRHGLAPLVVASHQNYENFLTKLDTSEHMVIISLGVVEIVKVLIEIMSRLILDHHCY
ncbi:unnamed protein product [Schistosoma margrebowiei]|uniref:glutaminase n=1 Tax=Schistosoma margrebowiei TaxID=48269 RepID=A0A183M8T1_9TREM|nr:unnamed protein product [Schistosoma margrebowiei]